MSLFDKFESAKGKAQQAAQKYGLPASLQPSHGGPHGHAPPAHGGAAPPSAHPGHAQVPGQDDYAYGQVGPAPAGPAGSGARQRPQGAPHRPGAPPSPAYAAGAGGGLGANFQLPHLLREGLAQFDPRLNTNREFYMYNAALKGVSIDFDAMDREQHKIAQASYEYGQDHVAQRRLDGVGDEVLVDVLDRFAYTSAVQGDLYQAHAKALEEARKQQKHAWLSAPAESDELLQGRVRRVQLHRQIKALQPQVDRAPGTSPQAKKLREAKDELAKNEHAMGPKEIEAAYAKRALVRTYYDTRGTELMRLGAQLVELGRYEKLLALQIPQGEQGRLSDPVLFPAQSAELDRSTQPAWSGAVRVSKIFAAIKPAIDTASPNGPAPAGPAASHATGAAVPAASGAALTAAGQSATPSSGEQPHVSFAALPTKSPVESFGPPAPPVPGAAGAPSDVLASTPAAFQPSALLGGPARAPPPSHEPAAPPLPSASHPASGAAAAPAAGTFTQEPITDEPELEEFHDAHESHAAERSADRSAEEQAWAAPARRGTEEYGNTGFNPFTSHAPAPVQAQSLGLDNPWAGNEAAATGATDESAVPAARAAAGAAQAPVAPAAPPAPAHDIEALRAQAARDAKEHEAQLEAARARSTDGSTDGPAGQHDGAPPPYCPS